ncbi:MFS-type transporter SLC18B1-like [Ischnura elegans]|uniref:MFS-type transporter SLC18B1-like n=1 Tax=Ischnura elegans TaxID=197161 RepID=UPI001ED8B3CE|nr:MFS-type transporter SLC18B1-like [Ischnura elegans]
MTESGLLCNGREDGVSQHPPPKKKFTRREWLTLYMLGSVNLATSICISVQAPFYPAEAEEKGASSTTYGLVFGVFEIVSFLSSPIFGKYINVLGVKFTLTAGILIAAVCCILFGFLDLIDSLDEFVGLSFAVRIVEALGAAAAVTATFSTTASVFKDCIGTTFATLEVFYGVGYIVGPTIGGLAFSLGGFKFPFIFTGSFLVIITVAVYFILPSPESSVETSSNGNDANLKTLLFIPAVFMNITAVMITSCTMGYYAAILEPHLREFNLTPVEVGLMFVISGTMYAIHAPLIGWLCDHGIKPKHCCSVGLALIILGCCLIGPAPFLPSPIILWMCILGLMLHGLGVACVLVSCFIDSIKTAVHYGFNDDLSTYAIVSGLWASAFSLGAFVGPSVAGALMDWVGFRQGTIFILVTQSIMLIAVLIFVCCEKKPVAQLNKEINGICMGNGHHIKRAKEPSSCMAEAIFSQPSSCSTYGSFNNSVRIIEVTGS